MSEITLRQFDRDLIFDLGHKLTGTMEVQSTRHEIVISNVMRRMAQIGKTNLISYLSYVSENESELSHFISAVTIHTTSWFREMPHYRRLERNLSLTPSKLQGRKLRLLSAACSTGEELYSFGMILESFRRLYLEFDYELVGFDVDPICVQRSDSGFYNISDINIIPQVYRHLLIPRNVGDNNYIIDPDIRKRCTFHVGNLLDPDSFIDDPFDNVVCRNVLIYFSEEKVNLIVSNLLSVVRPDGALTLGHSESIDARRFNLLAMGESGYKRLDETSILPLREKPITVLSIDDSSWVRLWLATALAEHGIKVITTDTIESASELLSRNKFDLITLDTNLQGKSGLAWLVELRKQNVKIPVMLLTETRAEQATEILESLSTGSQDYVNKSQLGQNSQEFVDRITGLVKAYRNRADMGHKPATYAEFKNKSPVQLFYPDLIVVGASTGGTEALCQVLAHLPPNPPPIVVVQHIPREFSSAFLERLARTTGLQAGAPEKGKDIAPGHIYLSTLDAHIGVRQHGDKMNVYYSHGDKISSHRPSVDYLFQTASFLRGKRILAFLLTGMGRDGAQGLLELKRNGALTLAQDERSSIVWGMPGEAVRLGAPMILGNLHELNQVLIQALNLEKHHASQRAG
jgi:chemotaxis response regulator CheB/chemotaxis methyl-accepting protein methylase